MGGGDSYGASLAGSASSGANQSGASDFSSRQNLFGTTYGPGSLVFGPAPSSGGGVSISTPVVIAVAALAGFILFLIFRK